APRRTQKADAAERRRDMPRRTYRLGLPRMMLEITDLSVSYGGLAALRGVSLAIAEGQFIAIVGPNGAGKTTLFKAISGTVPAGAGAIAFEGRDLLAVPPHERAHLGIAHVPEGRQVFASLTVQENLEMGAYSDRGQADWQSLAYLVCRLLLEKKKK